MATTDLFPLALEAMRAFAPHYASAMGQATEEAGMQGQDWGLVFMAFGAEPHGLTAARSHELVPYTAAQTLEARLADTANRGFIVPSEGSYRPTERGRRAIRGSFEAVAAALAELQPLPADDMRRLAGLLRRLVEATAASAVPEDKFSFTSSRLTDPGPEASLASQIDQYLTTWLATATMYIWRPAAHTTSAAMHGRPLR
jgi:hypothetical protein